MMKLTKKQAEDYFSGKLRLSVKRKTGAMKLIPSKGTKRGDRGVTPPEQRAYYRLWFIKNRKRRLAYERRMRPIRLAQKLAKVEGLEDTLENLTAQANLKRAKYGSVKTPAQKAARRKIYNQRYHAKNGRAPRVVEKKPGFFQRLFSWSLNA